MKDKFKIGQRVRIKGRGAIGVITGTYYGIFKVNVGNSVDSFVNEDLQPLKRGRPAKKKYLIDEGGPIDPKVKRTGKIMKNKTHGFQLHSGYLDCKKCQAIINSVEIVKSQVEDSWRIIDRETLEENSYILLTKSQLSELYRQLSVMKEKGII